MLIRVCDLDIHSWRFNSPFNNIFVISEESSTMQGLDQALVSVIITLLNGSELLLN